VLVAGKSPAFDFRVPVRFPAISTRSLSLSRILFVELPVFPSLFLLAAHSEPLSFSPPVVVFLDAHSKIAAKNFPLLGISSFSTSPTWSPVSSTPSVSTRRSLRSPRSSVARKAPETRPLRDLSGLRRPKFQAVPPGPFPRRSPPKPRPKIDPRRLLRAVLGQWPACRRGETNSDFRR